MNKVHEAWEQIWAEQEKAGHKPIGVVLSREFGRQISAGIADYDGLQLDELEMLTKLGTIYFYFDNEMASGEMEFM